MDKRTDKRRNAPRPAGSKREAPISWRPPAEERDAFFSRVRASGLTTNEYITRCVIQGKPPRQQRGHGEVRKDLAKILAECSAIRDGLQRLEKHAENDPDIALALQGAVQHLEVIATAIMQATGRK